MDNKSIDHLLSAIEDIIRAEGSWLDKKETIIEYCNPEQKTQLFEFVAWFDDADWDENDDDEETATEPNNEQ
jgi:hypothetical protein